VAEGPHRVGIASRIPLTPDIRSANDSGSRRDERRLRRSRHRTRSGSGVCCALDPVVAGAIFMMLERQEVAESVSRAAALPLTFAGDVAAVKVNDPVAR